MAPKERERSEREKAARAARMEESTDVVPIKPRKVGPKAPNSLSCMKKKKAAVVAEVSDKLSTGEEVKRKRKRAKKVAI